MKNKLFLLGIIILATGGIFAFFQSNNALHEAKPTHVVELKNGDTFDLTASFVKKKINGSEVNMLAYNGSIPGPIIKVPQGAEITVNFKNNTDIDSTLHSHGVRVENAFDGVPNVTQQAVKPGESFTYKLKFPDAGVFWYHPHVREDYAQELGLYGNFLVTPSQKDYWAEVDREETLFLDDISIKDGKIAPFDKENVDHTLMGRFGNSMLINGEDNYTLSVKQGERVRFYLTNAASTRVFNISIPNARMKLVGADNGKYEHEEWVNSVMLGPSERQIVEVWFDKNGEYKILHKTPEKTYTMGTITVAQHPVTTSYMMILRDNQDFISSLAPLRQLFSKPVDKRLNLTMSMSMNNDNNTSKRDNHAMSNMGGHDMENMNNHDMHMMHDGSMMNNNEMMVPSKIEWEDTMSMMNAMATVKNIRWKLVDDETKKENMHIDNWTFKKGDKVKIKIFNDPNSQHPMQHPIHIHGQRFLVLSTNGAPNTNLVWKDTVLVQTGDTVEILADMENPGTWMIHCHIPEHMESGMMMQFRVI